MHDFPYNYCDVQMKIEIEPKIIKIEYKMENEEKSRVHMQEFG